MNRIVSTIVILVLLGWTIESLDAWKVESSLNNGQKRLVKRRNKRDSPVFLPSTSFSGPCNYGDMTSCDQYAAHTTQIGVQLQKTINYVQQRKFFLSGLVSLPALQTGGMCVQNTNLLTPDGFSALMLGHMTMPQLSTLRLFPVQSLSMEMLHSAAYIHRYEQTNILSPLGIQAGLFNHVGLSQFQSLNLYPLQSSVMSSNFYQQAGYLHSDCLPTALGLAAAYIRYIPNNFMTSGCGSNENFPMSLERLVNAKYVYGSFNLLTTLGMAALHGGYLTRDIFSNYGCFPFNWNFQGQNSEYVYQEQTTQITTIVSDLIHTGYVYQNNLISNVGYYGLSKGYFSIDHFHRLNLWPCMGTPTLSMFVSAGYASYSGHFTTLGYSLYSMKYFSYEVILRLGIQVHEDFNIFHHILNYGGYIASAYHETHVAIHNAATYGGYGGAAAIATPFQAAGAAVASSSIVSSSDLVGGAGLAGGSGLAGGLGLAGGSGFVGGSGLVGGPGFAGGPGIIGGPGLVGGSGFGSPIGYAGGPGFAGDSPYLKK